MDYKTAVQAALDGDDDGFTYLYKSTYATMYHKALGYVKNRCDAEDVLQDSYMKARRSLETLSDPDKFPSWLSCIVSNTAMNYLKKKKPLLFFGMDEDSENEEVDYYEIEDDDYSFQPEEAYGHKEVGKILREMIDSLSDEQRLCMLMYHFDEQSIRDIANTISCSENTVKSRLVYGRKALRKKVEAMQKDGYRFYSCAPIPIFKYFMEKDSVTPEFLKAAKAAMEGSKAAASSQVNSAGNSTTLTVLKKTAGKRVLAACVSAAVVGSGTFAAWSISKNNGFVNLQNKFTDSNDSNIVENIDVSDYLDSIAGTPTLDELKAVLKALPDNYNYESLRTSEYSDLTEFLCHEIKENSITSSAITNKGYYKVEEINRLFSIFSNYIVSENNYDGKAYHEDSSYDGVEAIECDNSKEYSDCTVKIIEISFESEKMMIEFSREYDNSTNYVLDDKDYSQGIKLASLETDYRGDYRIKSIENVE